MLSKYHLKESVAAPANKKQRLEAKSQYVVNRKTSTNIEGILLMRKASMCIQVKKSCFYVSNIMASKLYKAKHDEIAMGHTQS